MTVMADQSQVAILYATRPSFVDAFGQCATGTSRPLGTPGQRKTSESRPVQQTMTGSNQRRNEGQLLAGWGKASSEGSEVA